MWVSAGALAATLALIVLIMLITTSSRARDEALGWERRTYEVIVMTRTIDAAVARSEAALGRYVLDWRQQTGMDYYNEWRNGAYQIGQLRQVLGADAEQSARAERLQTLFSRRGEELAPAAAAAQARRGQDGIGLLYQVASSPTPALRALCRLARAGGSARPPPQRTQSRRPVDAIPTCLAARILIASAAASPSSPGGLSRHGAGAARAAALNRARRALRRPAPAHRAHRATSISTEMTEASGRGEAAQVQKMEAVGQLTGGIAHDFNNMLAVVVGGLDLARRKLHGPRREVEYHLDNAMEGATRAAALTRRLLSFARAEPLLPEAIAPARLVEEMLELADRALGERITVQTTEPDEQWLVWADRTQLDNAILNLAVNARDAMDGAGELTIAVEHVGLRTGEVEALPAGDYVRIAVTDTGRGIAPEHLHRVFEPFFTTKALGKGTGLGLSQIFGFARQSGGEVTLASTVGKGTTVSLWLPRWIDEAGTARPPRARPVHLESTARARRALRILIVEDDPRVARATSGALEELGHRAVNAASGGEALALLEGPAADVDLVVTDVMMPEMTGAELAAAIRRRGLAVPILFVTGYVGEAGEAEDFAEGDLLRKPFTVAALAEAVENSVAGVSGSRRAATDAAA